MFNLCLNGGYTLVFILDYPVIQSTKETPETTATPEITVGKSINN